MRDGDRAHIAGFDVCWRAVSAPAGAGEPAEAGRPAFGLWVLADPDAPLDRITQEEFDQNDERMPYFGLVWPSAEALVRKILAGPRLDGLRVLDLGCGLGLCGFAAASRGARVTFFDWEPRAIEIARESARRSGSPATSALAEGRPPRPPIPGAIHRAPQEWRPGGTARTRPCPSGTPTHP